MEELLCRFALLWAVDFTPHSARRTSKALSTLIIDNSISAMRSLVCWISRKIFAAFTDPSLFTRIWTWQTAYSTKSAKIKSFVEWQLRHELFSSTPLSWGVPEVIPEILSMVKISSPLRRSLMFLKPLSQSLADFKHNPRWDNLNWASRSTTFSCGCAC